MDVVDLSVVLLARGFAPGVRMALSHLEVQTYPSGRFETLLVSRGVEGDEAAEFERYAAGAPIPIRLLKVTSSGAASARNQALAAARGRWVLFLDEEVLAAPELVAEHVRVQEEHGGMCAAVGAIRSHPQAVAIDAKRYFWNPAWVPAASGSVPWVEWRAFNLSLPVAALREAGGFDEGFGEAGLEDLALACRLSAKGLIGVHAASSVAFTWRGAAWEAEAARYYAEGYGLSRAAAQPGGELLRLRYAPLLDPLRAWVDAVCGPFRRRICRALAPGTPLHHLLTTKCLRRSFAQGYRDAAAGRPLRIR